MDSCKGEFVEMHKLLLKLLAYQKAEEGTEKAPGRAKGKKQIQDLNVWLQCFYM